MVQMKRQISPYNHSAGNDIKYIVVHDTGNSTDTAENNASYFNGGDRQASAHYFVDDDSIVQVVEDSNAAWHCGDGGMKYGIGNHNSIGIEMCRVNNTVTSTTEANAIELVKAKMTQYNIPIDRVVRHYDASRKCCPQSFSANNWARWSNFKAKLAGHSVTEIVESVDEFTLTVQKQLNYIMNVGLKEDGVMGTLTRAAIIAFEKKYGLSVDSGIWGPECARKAEELIKAKQQSAVKAVPAPVKPKYSVFYQTHVQNVGWQESKKDWEVAGTTGKSLRLEALTIHDNSPYTLKFEGHVENLGWTSQRFEGEVEGTVGQSKRLEAIKITLEGAPSNVHIEYQAHVQSIGWQPVVRDGAVAGTTGKSLRLEAIRIRIVED
ncbi:N-acetylmuramoyl-L-alanine amidase [Clostridium pasteurianum]|uniref:N-acetylmuramoyl-L-alanine amidase n=1 Tax=Clostridium pasteurianum TaxID=1501 RepID=UPI002260D780|nr:N-acetylmuramoyl-L-alanine amidase [Clostridium pasteurianum]UZW13180.1 N-acetylmuramoyl-L-alanine amidase [Clostridium pasteurianum]